MIKNFNLGICIVEKVDFKTNDMEIIVEGVENLSSNQTFLFSPATSKRVTLIMFLRGDERICAA